MVFAAAVAILSMRARPDNLRRAGGGQKQQHDSNQETLFHNTKKTGANVQKSFSSSPFL
jgi:hypothetical protein